MTCPTALYTAQEECPPPLLDECVLRDIIDVVATLPMHEEDDANAMSGSCEAAWSEGDSSAALSAAADVSADVDGANDFGECCDHERRRGMAYLVPTEDGRYKCAPGFTCKTPTEKPKELPRLFWHFCECCLVVLNSDRQLTLHTKGNKHIARVADLEAHFARKGEAFVAPPTRMVAEGTDKAAVDVPKEMLQAVEALVAAQEQQAVQERHIVQERQAAQDEAAKRKAVRGGGAGGSQAQAMRQMMQMQQQQQQQQHKQQQQMLQQLQLQQLQQQFQQQLQVQQQQQVQVPMQQPQMLQQMYPQTMQMPQQMLGMQQQQMGQMNLGGFIQ